MRASRRASGAALFLVGVASVLVGCSDGVDEAARDRCEAEAGVGRCLERDGEWVAVGSRGGTTSTVAAGSEPSSSTTTGESTTTTAATTTAPPVTTTAPTTVPPTSGPPPPANRFGLPPELIEREAELLSISEQIQGEQAVSIACFFAGNREDIVDWRCYLDYADGYHVEIIYFRAPDGDWLYSEEGGGGGM